MTVSEYEGAAEYWVSEDDALDFSAYIDMLDPEIATAVPLPHTRSTIEFTVAITEGLNAIWTGEKTERKLVLILMQSLNKF